VSESGKTILVVDDEPEVLRLVERILVRGGHKVLTAASSIEALAIATHPRRIDLLLSDVFLPCDHHCDGKGMLGPELAATLKQARPDMRVILISGETGKALAAGEWKFLEKPFRNADLLDLVHQELSRPSVQGAGR
jgi:CheY-like chemotaxis protein